MRLDEWPRSDNVERRHDAADDLKHSDLAAQAIP